MNAGNGIQIRKDPAVPAGIVGVIFLGGDATQLNEAEINLSGGCQQIGSGHRIL